MKTMIGFAVVFLTLGLTVGCSNSDSGSSNPAVYTGTGFGGGINGTGVSDPFGLYTGSPSQVLLETDTLPTITDGTTFRKYMRAIGVCSEQIIDTCSGYPSNPPGFEVSVDDYTLAGGHSLGSMVIQFANGAVFGYGPTFGTYLYWNAANANATFETQQAGVPGYPNYNLQLQVIFTGKTTDSQIPYTLSFGGNVFATGVVTRINQ